MQNRFGIELFLAKWQMLFAIVTNWSIGNGEGLASYSRLKPLGMINGHSSRGDWFEETANINNKAGASTLLSVS